jgi:hypothetical protein
MCVCVWVCAHTHTHTHTHIYKGMKNDYSPQGNLLHSIQLERGKIEREKVREKEYKIQLNRETKRREEIQRETIHT